MASSFWDWSAEAYRTPGAEETLVRLQDAHGLNVNLLLWCVWSATQFAAPDEAILRHAIRIAGEWEADVVSPLRGARRKMKLKGGAEALCHQIKEAELAAEREVQLALEAFARGHLAPANGEDQEGRVRRTLAAYARAAGAAKTAGFSIALLEKVAGLTVSRLD